MRRVRKASRDERGFTLIEVLLTIAISAIVLSTLTLAVAQGYSESSSAGARVDRSNLADFAADAFAADAASSSTAQPALVACGNAPTALDIAESDGSWVSYALTDDGHGTYTLERRTCDGVLDASGNDAVVQPVGSAYATSTQAPTLSGTCAGTCSLTVTWPDGKGGDFTLTGTRRSS